MITFASHKLKSPAGRFTASTLFSDPIMLLSAWRGKYSIQCKRKTMFHEVWFYSVNHTMIALVNKETINVLINVKLFLKIIGNKGSFQIFRSKAGIALPELPGVGSARFLQLVHELWKLEKLTFKEQQPQHFHMHQNLKNRSNGGNSFLSVLFCSFMNSPVWETKWSRWETCNIQKEHQCCCLCNVPNGGCVPVWAGGSLCPTDQRCSLLRVPDPQLSTWS